MRLVFMALQKDSTNVGIPAKPQTKPAAKRKKRITAEAKTQLVLTELRPTPPALSPSALLALLQR
jgi:hypothetical protein